VSPADTHSPSRTLRGLLNSCKSTLSYTRPPSDSTIAVGYPATIARLEVGYKTEESRRPLNWNGGLQKVHTYT